MYTGFFGLNEKPFSITPDPRYLFLSERHAEALAHLLYGVTESGGFIQLTGEVGTGKTTIVRSLLEQMPEDTEVALVLNPRLSPHEFLLAISEELRIPLTLEDRNSGKSIIDSLNRHLLEAHAAGRRIVLIVDEAQNLSPDVLEQIRLLTNLETAKQKLLQIILIGQPELRQLLGRTDLRQLAQRVTGRYHLEPLDREETRAYIRHRLRVAGGGGETFTNGAMDSIHHRAHGVPRLINVISDRALLGAYSREQTRVTRTTAAHAAREVSGDGQRVWSGGRYFVGGMIALIVILAGAFSWIRYQASMPISTFGATPAMTEPTAQPRQESAPTKTGPSPTPDRAEPATLPPTPAEAATEDVPVDAQVATAAAPTLAEILRERQADTDTDSAFAALLGLWGVDYQAGAGRACNVAESAGLRCLYERGTWGFVLNLNRPAILSLSTPDGAQHQVVLAGVTATGEAQLWIGGQEVGASLAELMPVWLGDFLLVWRPASGSGRVLTPGAVGEDVTWLRGALSQVLGREIPPGPEDEYDEVLRQAVEQFQRSRRLRPDGVAGARTMIALNTALGLGGRPRLTEGS
jgi:general secretion pathway protein A